MSEASSTDQIQAQIAEARADLAASVAELKAAVTPGALAKRGIGALGGWFTDEDGGIRPERVAIAGAVVAGFVAIVIVRRSRR